MQEGQTVYEKSLVKLFTIQITSYALRAQTAFAKNVFV